MYYVGVNNVSTQILGGDYTGVCLRTIFQDCNEYWLEVFGKVALNEQNVLMENYINTFKKWYSFFIFRIGGKKSRRIGNVYLEITERKRIEDEQHMSEERQVFLMKISDVLRPLSDPIEFRELLPV